MTSPALKLAIGRLGHPEISEIPHLLGMGGGGAVLVCNHVGWADSIWLAYALHPRRLRFISKQELFSKPITRWIFEQSGCLPINRDDPAPSSIKSAVELLRGGELLLIFPSGTRSSAGAVFKRGAATIALHAQVPIVPVFYHGPPQMHVSHLVNRPRVRIRFGEIIPTEQLAVSRSNAAALTMDVQRAITLLHAIETSRNQKNEFVYRSAPAHPTDAPAPNRLG